MNSHFRIPYIQSVLAAICAGLAAANIYFVDPNPWAIGLMVGMAFFIALSAILLAIRS